MDRKTSRIINSVINVLPLNTSEGIISQNFRFRHCPSYFLLVLKCIKITDNRQTDGLERVCWFEIVTQELQGRNLLFLNPKTFISTSGSVFRGIYFTHTQKDISFMTEQFVLSPRLIFQGRFIWLFLCLLFLKSEAEFNFIKGQINSCVNTSETL